MSFVPSRTIAFKWEEQKPGDGIYLAEVTFTSVVQLVVRAKHFALIDGGGDRVGEIDVKRADGLIEDIKRWGSPSLHMSIYTGKGVDVVRFPVQVTGLKIGTPTLFYETAEPDGVENAEEETGDAEDRG